MLPAIDRPAPSLENRREFLKLPCQPLCGRRSIRRRRVAAGTEFYVGQRQCNHRGLSLHTQSRSLQQMPESLKFHKVSLGKMTIYLLMPSRSCLSHRLRILSRSRVATRRCASATVLLCASAYTVSKRGGIGMDAAKQMSSSRQSLQTGHTY